MEISTEKKPCRTYPTRPTVVNPAPPPRLLYSRKEGAYLLSVSIRALDYLIAEGRINTRRIGGRILVSHDELARFARHDRRKPITPESGSLPAEVAA